VKIFPTSNVILCHQASQKIVFTRRRKKSFSPDVAKHIPQQTQPKHLLQQTSPLKKTALFSRRRREKSSSQDVGKYMIHRTSENRRPHLFLARLTRSLSMADHLVEIIHCVVVVGWPAHTARATRARAKDSKASDIQFAWAEQPRLQCAQRQESSCQFAMRPKAGIVTQSLQSSSCSSQCVAIIMQSSCVCNAPNASNAAD
jgi:hypothetical protein